MHKHIQPLEGVLLNEHPSAVGILFVALQMDYSGFRRGGNRGNEKGERMYRKTSNPTTDASRVYSS